MVVYFEVHKQWCVLGNSIIVMRVCFWAGTVILPTECRRHKGLCNKSLGICFCKSHCVVGLMHLTVFMCLFVLR